MATKMNPSYLFGLLLLAAQTPALAQKSQPTLNIGWEKTTHVSKTTPTLQLVENPMVRPSSPIHKQTFAALKDLGADYVRYVPWFPYPKMAVAELKAPTKEATFWDFTYLDSTMNALMEATSGHTVVINFSTTPAWMWKTNATVPYPADAYTPTWDYNQGGQLRDTTGKELAEYYQRLFSWYTAGGFTDELGKFHQSGHHYKIPYWEVLNEPDLEHNISPQVYTRIYDAIVKELKKVSPQTKFIGMSLAYAVKPEYFEYFLDAKNHTGGIVPEGISYHFYATPSWEDQAPDAYHYTFFEKADAFLDRVRFIESIRKRVAPKTFTTINEIGSILRSPQVNKPIDANYWSLSGATYAYLLLELTKMGIDVAGESQLVGYPTQFPDVSMMNWETGKPNARYWVLHLLHEHFGPGDKLVETSFRDGNPPGVIAQGIITRTGKKVLFINTRELETSFSLPAEMNGATISVTDITTQDNPPAQSKLSGSNITIRPFAVAVATLN
jgi:hypothetical protein